MEMAAERMREVAARAGEGSGCRGKRSGGGYGGPGQIAIRWVLDREAVTSAIVGIRTMEQLEDVVAAEGEDRLTESEARILQTAFREQRYEEHR